jgi:hypothetical protein
MDGWMDGWVDGWVDSSLTGSKASKVEVRETDVFSSSDLPIHLPHAQKDRQERKRKRNRYY